GDAGGGTGGTARVRAGPAPGYHSRARAAVLLLLPGVRGRHVPASAIPLPTCSATLSTSALTLSRRGDAGVAATGVAARCHPCDRPETRPAARPQRRGL